MPFLSIITINYNNAAGLRKTLESVRTQSFTDYEHIIVDGGSTDGSVEVIQEFLQDAEYAKHVSWWCSEKDKGIYNAMNKGIQHAKGERVYMLNSGDALIHDVLLQVVPYLREHENEVVYGAVDCYKGNSFFRTACLSANRLKEGMIPHQGTFVPTVLHKNFGLYDESYSIVSDREMMLRLKFNGVNFFHIPIVVSDYNEEGISIRNGKLVVKESKKIDEIYFPKSVKIKFVFFVKRNLKLLLPGVIVLALHKLNCILRKLCKFRERGVQQYSLVSCLKLLSCATNRKVA